MENQSMVEGQESAYEAPALVAVGDFSEDTLGFGNDYSDFLGEQR
ncbi:lasso RiPP family leader peptide-containing protein [Streptomyces sp. Z26]|nr:lasso RiPP family leader peptide-containing protein [Streptomyces sp. Z26]RLL69863.1 lasso RiPP family leader peptide-containing protein [Streptomyces sp. Z26]